MIPDHINPLQWHQALGVARQACARIFRDGGTPADALKAFGAPATAVAVDWAKAVDQIAERLCAAPLRRAA
jgi:hypothetical protein